MSRSSKRRKRSGLGQVVVEMLLILPVFLTLVFTIFEMGNLAFWVIVLNHATYESARIGALRATGPDGGEPRDVTAVMNNVMRQIIRTAKVTAVAEPHGFADRQAAGTNADPGGTGSYNVPLVFPISSLLLAKPRGTGVRQIVAVVRMPIERPLQR